MRFTTFDLGGHTQGMLGISFVCVCIKEAYTSIQDVISIRRDTIKVSYQS